MSIILRGISYRHANQEPLFSNISLSVPDGAKVSLIGANGVGKSTILHIMAGGLSPATGSVTASSRLCHIPQNIASDSRSVADMLGVADKIEALRAICAGSVDPILFDTLSDDWEIEERCRTALAQWGLSHVRPDTPASKLSGGERTRAMLAGLALHSPDTVLLDEPTNHLDRTARARLYRYIEQTTATLIVVSHDITLLNLLDVTCELTPAGIKSYGGNYDFYRIQRETEEQALAEQIEAGRNALRTARKRAQETRQRQERRTAQGERNKSKGGAARIIMNARGSQAEKSTSRLCLRHNAIIENTQHNLNLLRQKQTPRAELKIDIDNAAMHTGKRLVRATGLNFAYDDGVTLWSRPLDIEICSGGRVHITGDNGSGKTTLVRLLLGQLSPTHGHVERADFSTAYLDQDYTALDTPLTVLQMAGRHNVRHLADHDIKMRLDRALFPLSSWSKPCHALSGGERMRLMLCCIMISDHAPDLFVLDEPTNNLDIESLDILTDTIGGYGGTLMVISHDDRFIDQIGITQTIDLTPLRP